MTRSPKPASWSLTKITRSRATSSSTTRMTRSSPSWRAFRTSSCSRRSWPSRSSDFGSAAWIAATGRSKRMSALRVARSTCRAWWLASSSRSASRHVGRRARPRPRAPAPLPAALHICELIHDQLVIDEINGDIAFRDFVEDPKKMPLLFESFVRNFFEREAPGWSVKRDDIAWTLKPLSPLFQTTLQTSTCTCRTSTRRGSSTRRQLSSLT